MPYRVYLLLHGHIRAAHGFAAEGDPAAVEVAALLLQSCCDEFEAYELWCGTRHVHGMARAGLPMAPTALATLTQRRQEQLCDLEEALQNSFAAVMKSRLLLARVGELRGILGARWRD